MLTEIGTQIMFASQAISALDLSWPFTAPGRPHTLQPFPQELDVLNSPERAKKLAQKLVAFREPQLLKLRIPDSWYWQQGFVQGQLSPQESRFGSVMQLEGFNAWSTCLIYVLCRCQISAELCLSLVILIDSRNEFCVQSAKCWELWEEEEDQRASESLHP